MSQLENERFHMAPSWNLLQRQLVISGFIAVGIADQYRVRLRRIHDAVHFQQS
jgi:hypothetical protein